MTTARKPRLKPYAAVEYTHGKHVLKPGDAAIAVTTCTNRGELRVGKYLGLRHGAVVMEVHDVRKVLVDANDVPYDNAAERKELPYPPYPSGVRYGSPEYKTAQAQYQADYKVRQDKINERQKGFDWKEFPYKWRTQLQNNNIYPAGIALVDVKL